jgi:lysine 6-dehydrogenase
MRILVLGAGRMAYGAVHDFLTQLPQSKIHVTDISEKALKAMQGHFKTKRLVVHLLKADDRLRIPALMKKADGVFSAVPYDYNLQLTRWAVENKCHFVDLGGNNTVVNQQFKLDARAKKAGVGIIPDCGLAPGMVSVLAAHMVKQLDSVENLTIRVGGLPLQPQNPLRYMLVFSIHGLINEYIEPAVIIQDSQITTVPSMTATEDLEFPAPFGKLEAFYTSGGTSTLPHTYLGKIQNLNYKTIRYPGHCQLFKSMIDLGFTTGETVTIGKNNYSRREVFETLLTDPLTYPGEDVVLIRLWIKGLKNNVPEQITMEAVEYGDHNNKLTAMMRTTAFPASIILIMLINGWIQARGVLRQESAVPSEIFIHELEKRNINFKVY